MKPGSEAAWMQTVTNLAVYLGWRFYHSPDNRPIRMANGRVRKQHVVPGFPDLVLLRGPEILVVELKAEKGRVSPEQRDWLSAFAAAGVETHVWFPADWAAVRERLAARTPNLQVAA